MILVWKPDIVLVVVLALIDSLPVDGRHFHWIVNRGRRMVGLLRHPSSGHLGFRDEYSLTIFDDGLDWCIRTSAALYELATFWVIVAL